jgi:hypothetical protein
MTTLLVCGIAAAGAPNADAQAMQEGKTAEPTGSATSSSEVPQVPGMSSETHGLNAGITFSGVHDAATGWSTLATPALGYSFNAVFSADVSIPIYMYRLAESLSSNPKPGARLVNQRGELGDTVLSVHAQFAPKLFDYQLTAASALPTGDEAYGLTSGRVTFDVNNQFDHAFARVTPSLEIGIGDSATLANRQITKNYTSLGPLAHFEIGFGIPLPRGASFETDAFEELPIGDQKIYTTTTRKKVTTTVVTGRNVSEDNGFINSLELPLTREFTLSSYYTRSLRNHDDTVSMGLTYVLRAHQPETGAPDVDILFR